MKWINSYMIYFALLLTVSSCASEKIKQADDYIGNNNSNVWYCYIGLTGRDRSLALISKYQMENKLDNFCLNELKFTLNYLKKTKLTI
ncbi:MAG TPA: hypothetical protein ENJ51_08300, partial [Leucothrix mucor]|nr:hypothetical protein [Leucothrix mucor]